MEREIKFRIIHKNKIVGYEHLTENGWRWNWIELNPDKGERWSHGVIQDSTPKAMTRNQFTGLKDKNGKDVFHGDLYQVAGNNVYEIRYIDKMQVQSGGFEIYAACFVLWISEEIFFPFDEFAIEHGEVIGNIYENPELLNNG